MTHGLASDTDPEIYRLLAAYCIDCHGPDRARSGLRFDGLKTEADAMEMAEDIEIAHQRVRDREMPPRDQPQPTPAERERLLDWMRGVVSDARGAAAPDPGWFTIHRLNRAEYQNTLRDLLGIEPRATDLTRMLPPDDIGHGFDNNADVLSISPLHMEAYLDAAELALELALGPAVDTSTTPRPIRNLEATTGGRALPRGGHFLFSNGAARADVTIPATGDYEIRVTTWGDRGGDELPRLSVRIDGREVGARFVEAERESEAEVFAVTTRIRAGARDIAAHFTNDFYIRGVADRNLAIGRIEIAGPLDARTIERPAGYREIMLEEPPPDDASRRAAAERVITRFASRAFRRPASPDEIERFMRLYDRSRSEGDGHEQSVRQMLAATLISPAFLYRSVANPTPSDPTRIYTLSGHELASRLSYFLWSSMPDEELRRLADLGLLTDERVLRAQTRRMLEDPRADAFIQNFSGQWLLLRNLESLEIDRARFPEYTDELRADMKAEVVHFFDDIVRRDRSAYDLIDARDTFLNERLASLYGIEGVRGEGLRRVVLHDGSSRGGVLTTGAVLTVTSNPTRTSPVKRGLYVLDQMLGAPPPPPPPEIPPLEEAIRTLGPDATTREQLAAHVADAACASCHMRMDPLGLSMEHFDAIGRFRLAENGVPIDASGELPSGERLNDAQDLKRVLLDRRDEFLKSLTSRLLTYALGRGTEPFDAPAIEAIASTAAANDARFQSLIEAIVCSDTFRTCRGRETP